MFFRRRPSKPPAFEDRMEALRHAGFLVEHGGSGSFEVRKQGCGAVVGRSPGGTPAVIRAGVLVNGQIAALVDRGFQKFLETDSGLRRPALAADLTALHAFQEDLRKTLGIESLYNLSLGTVFDRHAYDRLQGR